MWINGRTLITLDHILTNTVKIYKIYTFVERKVLLYHFGTLFCYGQPANWYHVITNFAAIYYIETNFDTYIKVNTTN